MDTSSDHFNYSGVELLCEVENEADEINFRGIMTSIKMIRAEKLLQVISKDQNLYQPLTIFAP